MNTKRLKLIKSSNFNNLSVMEKRVALAQDVLQRVGAKTLVASEDQSFFYVIGKGIKHGDKTVINNAVCEVCVKGAILCSFIGNFNKYDMGGLDYNTVPDYPPELLEIFNPAMLDAMEIAFEKETDIFGNDTDYDTMDSLISTFPQFKSHERLIAIMENIIKNEGKIICNDGIVVE